MCKSLAYLLEMVLYTPTCPSSAPKARRPSLLRCHLTYVATTTEDYAFSYRVVESGVKRKVNGEQGRDEKMESLLSCKPPPQYDMRAVHRPLKLWYKLSDECCQELDCTQTQFQLFTLYDSYMRNSLVLLIPWVVFPKLQVYSQIWTSPLY